MNYLSVTSKIILRNSKTDIIFPSLFHVARTFSEDAEVKRISLEKSVNHVTLLGRVGSTPQLRGNETKPVVVFTLATNTNYKYDSGEVQQKTDWHRISVFKPYLRNTVIEHLRKGSRVYVEGRILYGEFCDETGVKRNTTSIVAQDVIFLASSRRREPEETMQNIEETMPNVEETMQNFEK